jgi:hypothetical protein
MKHLIALLAALACVSAPASAGNADAGFLPLQDPIVVYNNWSAYDELSDNVLQTEQLAMKQLDELLRLRRRGVRFDYYMMDAFWYAKEGAYRTWRKATWPNGPDGWLARCKENGIKPGLWFGTNMLVQLDAAPEWQDSLSKRAGPRASSRAVLCRTSCKRCRCGTTAAFVCLSSISWILRRRHRMWKRP